MKTHILQLEVHDDIISAHDKMGWVKAGRILLVWPERGQVLNRRLDLLILHRHSQALGAQLALVSRDREVRYHAPRLGIPIFKSLRKAQSAHWRVPRRFRKTQTETAQAILEHTHSSFRPPERRIPSKPESGAAKLTPMTRLVFFTLGVLALLSIAATLLPNAEVILIPKTEIQETTISVSAIPDTTGINLSGEVPAHKVSVIVEGREALPVSGSILLPDRPATGQVLFSNLTDRPVDIPAGAVVRGLDPDAVRFAVTRAATIPAGPEETLLLPVRSLTPGSQGNLPAESLTAIEGILGTQVRVTNPDPTQVGSDRREPAPDTDDRRKLSAQLHNSLQDTALKELYNSLGAGDLLVPSSLRLLQVLDESFHPTEKQPADHLNLSLRLEFEALIVSGEDLRALAQAVFEANLPAGYSPLDESIKIENLSAPVLGEDSISSWKMRASRQIQARLHAPQAIQLSLGLPPDQAIERLEAALPLDRKPHINLFPYWWPRLPILPFRITIRNQEPGS